MPMVVVLAGSLRPAGPAVYVCSSLTHTISSVASTSKMAFDLCIFGVIKMTFIFNHPLLLKKAYGNQFIHNEICYYNNTIVKLGV